MMRRLAKVLFAIVILLVGAAALRILASWMFGESPYVQYLRLMHDDIPRFVVPVRLQQGITVTFPARIIEKRGYELNILVYFKGDQQRAAVENLIGGAITQPKNVAQPAGQLQSLMHIVVTDESGRVVYDRTELSDGHTKSNLFLLGRELARFRLEDGPHSISVTPMNDVSALDPFGVEFELTYGVK